MRIYKLAVGNVVQSKIYPQWVGEVMEIADDHRGALVSWETPSGGYIRTWSYIDSLAPLRRRRR